MDIDNLHTFGEPFWIVVIALIVILIFGTIVWLMIELVIYIGSKICNLLFSRDEKE